MEYLPIHVFMAASLLFFGFVGVCSLAVVINCLYRERKLGDLFIGIVGVTIYALIFLRLLHK